MHYEYRTHGTCSSKIAFDLNEDGTIHNIVFTGGCPGNLVEVMTCVDGCVGGAGQPRALREGKHQRSEGLYAADRDATMKFSQSNPVVKALYETELKEDAHELLHVHYPSAGEA